MATNDSWLLERKSGWLSACLQALTEWNDPGEVKPKPPPSPLPAPTEAKKKETASLLIADPFRLDLHLSYSAGLDRGPIIHRRGDDSPIMEDPEKPGNYTADPDLQRIGSYFIKEEQRFESLKAIAFRFAGTYILRGWLIDLEPARKEAAQTFLTYFPQLEITDFPLPPPLLAGDFSHTIVEFAKSAELLKVLEISETVPGHWHPSRPETALSAEAFGSMEEIYGQGFLFNLAVLKGSLVFQRTVEYNLVKYLRLLILLSKTSSHDGEARKKDARDLVLMQGCGDLTMNEWNVAFVSGPSLAPGEQQPWNLLHAPGEPLNDRKYTCLIKWRCKRDDPDLLKIAKKVRIVYPYQIASLTFLAPSLGSSRPDRHVFLQDAPIGHLIEFAVYGRRVLRSGRAANLTNIVHEFNDVRHIFTLPNLNRNSDYPSVAANINIQDYREKPRNLFNRSAQDDVWLGEAALLQGDRNLRVAALWHAVQLNTRDLGAPTEWIDTVLQEDGPMYGYEKTPLGAGADIDSPGQWRWIREGRRTWLEIFFLRSHYPCSMIGIQAEDEGEGQPCQQGLVRTRKIYFLAHGHIYNRGSCTIRQAAKYLRSQGAWDGLLFDEGMDVFQLVQSTESRMLEEAVRLERKQLRCVFWGTETTPEEWAGCGDSGSGARPTRRSEPSRGSTKRDRLTRQPRRRR